MKILHVIPAIAATYGGPSRAVLEICRSLNREGIDSRIVTTSANAEQDLKAPLEEGIAYQGAPVWFFKRTIRGEFKFSVSLRSWLRTNTSRFQILHLHSVFCYPTTEAAWCARKYGIPYIVRPAGNLEEWSLAQKSLKKAVYLEWIEKKNLNHASALHYTSEAERQKSSSLQLRAPSVVIPLGISASEYVPKKGGFRARHHIPANRKLILFLSRLHPKKGIEILLRSLSELKNSEPEWTLVVAGRGEPSYEAVIRKEVEERGLAGNVLFAGFSEGESKAELLADADLFVLPSYQENFGIAVAEAMQAGLPVIVSDRVNIHPDIHKSGAGCVLPLDSKYWTETIADLLKDHEKRVTLGKNGRQLAAEKFSSRRMALDLIALYENLLKRNGASGNA